MNEKVDPIVYEDGSPSYTTMMFALGSGTLHKMQVPCRCPSCNLGFTAEPLFQNPWLYIECSTCPRRYVFLQPDDDSVILLNLPVPEPGWYCDQRLEVTGQVFTR